MPNITITQLSALQECAGWRGDYTWKVSSMRKLEGVELVREVRPTKRATQGTCWVVTEKGLQCLKDQGIYDRSKAV